MALPLELIGQALLSSLQPASVSVVPLPGDRTAPPSPLGPDASRIVRLLISTVPLAVTEKNRLTLAPLRTTTSAPGPFIFTGRVMASPETVSVFLIVP